MADADAEWTPQPYVSGAERPRGKGSIFDPDRGRTEAEGPKAFVTGWPVWHSRSPLIHGSWLKDLGLAGSYRRLGVPPEEIADFLQGLADSGFVGGNVTLPHKVAAFEAVSRRDAAAEATGAVNTLWFDESRRLVGGNTDAYGFAANLDERLAGWADAETAVVLGAGGAARAVVVALVSRGATVTVHARRVEAARELARSQGAAVGQWPPAPGSWDLLVNCTPLGGVGARDESPMSREGLKGRFVYDLTYGDRESVLLRDAREMGCGTLDGLPMLVAQAERQFEWWTGQRPVPGVMAEAIRKKVASWRG